MTEEYITQVSTEIEGKVTKKMSQEFSRTKFLGALSKIDEFLLNPQVRTCSVVVPGTSRNNNSVNLEPTGDRSLNDPFPEVEFFACRTSNSTVSDPEETSHNIRSKLGIFTCQNYGWGPLMSLRSSQWSLCYVLERLAGVLSVNHKGTLTGLSEGH